MIITLIAAASHAGTIAPSTVLPGFIFGMIVIGGVVLNGKWDSIPFRATLAVSSIVAIWCFLVSASATTFNPALGILVLLFLALLIGLFHHCLKSSPEQQQTPDVAQEQEQNSALIEEQSPPLQSADDGAPTKIQTELIHSEKLKALGMMSAGLTHEINNPLNYSILGVEVLKEEGRTMMAPEFESVLSDVEDGLHRIRNIIKDLKVFAHKDGEQSSITETFLMGDAIASAVRITAKLTENIEVTTTMATPYRVVGEASSIVQVLVNLIANATESIHQKWQEPDGRINIYGKIVDDMYLIEVVDNGVGISKEGIENIFTPFYTTKSTGVGTGLGLSICHTIIKRNGGSFQVESIPSEWASMAFNLPIANQ